MFNSKKSIWYNNNTEFYNIICHNILFTRRLYYQIKTACIYFPQKNIIRYTRLVPKQHDFSSNILSSLLCACFCLCVSDIFGTPQHHNSPSSSSSAAAQNVLPYFDFDVQRNLTVTVGQTGFLHCRVERLGDKDVSFSF